MFWKLQYKFFLKKGLNFFLPDIKNKSRKNLVGVVNYKVINCFILDIHEILFWTYILVFFLQKTIHKNGRLLLASKLVLDKSVFNYFKLDPTRQGQLFKMSTKWVGGSISNFVYVRWFYFFNRVFIYRTLPDIFVLLEHTLGHSLLDEAHNVGLPCISYTNLFYSDFTFLFLFFGSLDIYAKKNNFFFFLFLIRNMLALELGLKKKKTVALTKVTPLDLMSFKRFVKKTMPVKKRVVFITKNRKGWFRFKSNKPLRLLRDFFDIEKKFKVRFKKVNIRVNLILKLLLRYCSFKEDLFTKHSGLVFMAKFRKVNYLFSSEMTTNFLFLLERRLQTLIWRLFVLKTGKLPGVRNLILGGFLKVDNLVIKNPSFLVKQESFVRFIKEPPRLWDRTSFRHLGLLKNFIDKSRGLWKKKNISFIRWEQLRGFSKERNLKVCHKSVRWFWLNKRVKVIQRSGCFNAYNFFWNTKFFFFFTKKEFISAKNLRIRFWSYSGFDLNLDGKKYITEKKKDLSSHTINTSSSIFVGDSFFIADVCRSFFKNKPVLSYKLSRTLCTQQKLLLNGSFYLGFVTRVSPKVLFSMDLFFLFLAKLQEKGFKFKNSFTTFNSLNARALKNFFVLSHPRIFCLLKKEISKCLGFLKVFLRPPNKPQFSIVNPYTQSIGRHLRYWFKKKDILDKNVLDLAFSFIYFFFSILLLKNKGLNKALKHTYRRRPQRKISRSNWNRPIWSNWYRRRFIRQEWRKKKKICFFSMAKPWNVFGVSKFKKTFLVNPWVTTFIFNRPVNISKVFYGKILTKKTLRYLISNF